ncbi:MAG: hypothetical protein AB1733_07370 [Thermodesulfobacteriota bacterium]
MLEIDLDLSYKVLIGEDAALTWNYTDRGRDCARGGLVRAEEPVRESLK